MELTYYILILVFSSFTGWFSIWFILKLLFWPKKQLSVFGFNFQGILPRYQAELAIGISETVGEKLFPFTSLKEKAADPVNFERLRPEIEYHIDHFLREKLKDSFPMLSMFIGDKTINQLKAAFLLELESLFPVIMKSYLSNLEKDLNPQKIIAEKIAAFSFEKSDVLKNKTAKKVINRLQLFGFLAGLLFGLLQTVLFMQLHQ